MTVSSFRIRVSLSVRSNIYDMMTSPPVKLLDIVSIDHSVRSTRRYKEDEPTTYYLLTTDILPTFHRAYPLLSPLQSTATATIARLWQLQIHPRKPGLMQAVVRSTPLCPSNAQS